MGFEPFMPYSESDTFNISSDKIVLSCKPTGALKEHYINATSEESASVIDTSQSGIIV